MADSLSKLFCFQVIAIYCMIFFSTLYLYILNVKLDSNSKSSQFKLISIFSLLLHLDVRRLSARKSLYLWEFLFGLLEDEDCDWVLSWTNKKDGVFEVKNSEELAKLWGTVKNRPKMDQYKLFRAMRTYYDKGLLKKIKDHQRVYQFIYIPYELEGCGQKVKSPDVKEGMMPSMEALKHSAPESNQTSMQTPSKRRDSTENEFDSWENYRCRDLSPSELSTSSEDSCASLDEDKRDLNSGLNEDK